MKSPAIKESGKVRIDLMVLLLIYYSIYVIGDLATSYWLILNDPYGILHEANPIGRTLYLNQGLVGLLIGKLMAFIPLSTIVIIFEAKYRNLSWFRETTETVMLGLITYSLTIFLNNFTAIIAIAFSKGQIMQLHPTIKGLILVLSTSISIILLRIHGYRHLLMASEVALGTAVTIGPLLLFDPLFEYLGKNLWSLMGYTISILTVVGAFFYIIDEIIKERKHKLSIKQPSQMVGKSDD